MIFAMKRLILLVSLLVLAPICHAVEFPGPAPGAAHGAVLKTGFVLENDVLQLRWAMSGNAKGETLRLVEIGNKISGQSVVQSGRELFRLRTPQAEAALNAPTPANGVYLAFRLGDRTIEALSSFDNKNWRTLQTLSRATFPGKPGVVRLGKMSLKADATDFADPGVMGTSRVGELSVFNPDGTPIRLGAPAKVATSPRAGTTAEFDGVTLKIGATQNSTAFAEWLLPDTQFVGAHVWKDSDKGLSWGPGLALIWPGGQFVKLNARSLSDFALTTQDGESLLGAGSDYPLFDLSASQFRLEGVPQIRPLTAPEMSAKKAPSGQELTATFRHATLPLHVEWRATLADGAHYAQQSLKVISSGAAPELRGVELLDCAMPNARQIGRVAGSPIEATGLFFSMESPFGVNEARSDGLRAGLLCRLPLNKGAGYEFSSVIGVAPPEQLRRAFLSYIERERARPATPFLITNSRYDLGRYANETDLTNSIGDLHRALTTDRGVPIDSYVLDDGWDDARNTFWNVDAQKFPNGFAPLAARLTALNSHLGLWISPLGGAGEAPQRVANARALKLANSNQLDLGNPAYYRWFRDRSLQFLRENQINYFDWDKTGNAATPQFMAMTNLARELRAANPNLFLNLTSGTWPSPFWLNVVDATWRGGGEMGWAGAGNKREQWLTYRDVEIYRQVVQRAPLYPLNAVTSGGIVLGQFGQGRDVALAGPDLRHDARLYFASGASLHELYLTPSLMTPQGWDDVAAAGKWAKANADVLADSHWIGGDPQRGEVYGYASWASRKGIFVLRNPSDKSGEIALDAGKIFELPAGATRNFKLVSPYADQRVDIAVLRVGESAAFKLEPFEVLVFEALSQ